MNQNKQAPIGVFDSGVGGLTVARESMRNLPSERIVSVSYTHLDVYKRQNRNR